MQSPRKSLVYRFDEFELDVGAGQLRKRGHKLRLAGQPIEILTLLLERQGHVISREELRQRLWSEETFVDFENSLNKAISSLRQALSDSPAQPAYIETLPRRGYRFLKPVEQVEPQVTAKPDTDSASSADLRGTPAATRPDSPQSSPEPWTRTWLPLGVLVAVLLLIGAWIVSSGASVPQVLSVSELTTASRIDAYGRLATDGVRLFFLERRGSHWQLCHMPVSGGPVQPFASPSSNSRVLAVSPDGSELLIAPFEMRATSLPLWIIPSVGGNARRLGAVVAQDGTFSPDGKRITYATEEGVFEVDRDGLNPTKLFDADGLKEGLTWSRDDNELRYQRAVTAQEPYNKTWFYVRGSKEPQRLFADQKEQSAECCGQWSSNDRYFLFVRFHTDGSRELLAQPVRQRFHIGGKSPIQLHVGPLLPDRLALNPDGKHIYALGFNMRQELVRYEESTRQFRSLLNGQNAYEPSFSTTGPHMVYLGLASALFRSALDGSGATQIVSPALHPSLATVSPDGKTVAFTGIRDGRGPKVYVVAMEGGEPEELPTGDLQAEAPSWSPEGMTILFSGPDSAAPACLFRYDLKSHALEKVVGSEGLRKSAWSPDGKYIAAVEDDNTSIHVYELATKRWHELTKGKVLSPVMWSRDSKYVVYQDVLEENEPVRRISVNGGKSQILLDCSVLLEGGVNRCGLEAVMPDGSPVLLLTRGDHDLYSIAVDLP